MDHETPSPLKTRTLVAQGLGLAEPVTRALVSPIHMSTTYLRDADNGYSGGRIYGVTDNPSVQQAESLIAALEGADVERPVFCEYGTLCVWHISGISHSLKSPTWEGRLVL